MRDFQSEAGFLSGALRREFKMIRIHSAYSITVCSPRWRSCWVNLPSATYMLRMHPAHQISVCTPPLLGCPCLESNSPASWILTRGQPSPTLLQRPGCSKVYSLHDYDEAGGVPVSVSRRLKMTYLAIWSNFHPRLASPSLSRNELQDSKLSSLLDHCECSGIGEPEFPLAWGRTLLIFRFDRFSTEG